VGRRQGIFEKERFDKETRRGGGGRRLSKEFRRIQELHFSSRGGKKMKKGKGRRRKLVKHVGREGMCEVGSGWGGAKPSCKT